MSLVSTLNAARKGRSLLFLGAGFSADCLNYSQTELIGASGNLLKLLNEQLKNAGHNHTFKDIKNAADEFIDKIGEHELLLFLQSHFFLRSISQDMIEILRYPWTSIYTTNYDNAVEIAGFYLKRRYNTFNNIDIVEEKTNSVIHLHGCAAKWDINSFASSCVLGLRSYLSISSISKWVSNFRTDCERSHSIYFVGFSAADMHLNEAIFNVSGIRDKVYFINAASATPDLDLIATQKQFGTPIFIGKEGFAAEIKAALFVDLPIEPSLSNFSKIGFVEPNISIPKVSDIDEMFILGSVNESQIYRDLLIQKPDYHIIRDQLNVYKEFLNSGSNVFMVTGEICDGKSVFIKDIIYTTSSNGSCYYLKHCYTDVIEELNSIISYDAAAIVVIENCFTLNRDILNQIVNISLEKKIVLILSSRNIVYESENLSFETSKWTQSPFFKILKLGKLSERENYELIALIDQVAGWQKVQYTERSQKIQFINKECKGSLPGFLLRLLASPHIRDIFKLEYNKLSSFDLRERNLIIICLYISHVGTDISISFLSEYLQFDVGRFIDDFNRRPNTGLRFIARNNSFVRTIPSVGASNILEHIIDDSHITEALVSFLNAMCSTRHFDSIEDYLFKQMMRYSVLSRVVKDNNVLNRFFDNISKIEKYRNYILFWLQWHMYCVAKQDYVNGEKYLNQAYNLAKAYELRTGIQYNRLQLDDRKSKFLMFKAIGKQTSAAQTYKDIDESCQIVKRLISLKEITFHPFETLIQIVKALRENETELGKTLTEVTTVKLRSLLEHAEANMGRLPVGFQKGAAENAVRLARLDLN